MESHKAQPETASDADIVFDGRSSPGSTDPKDARTLDLSTSTSHSIDGATLRSSVVDEDSPQDSSEPPAVRNEADAAVNIASNQSKTTALLQCDPFDPKSTNTTDDEVSSLTDIDDEYILMVAANEEKVAPTLAAPSRLKRKKHMKRSSARASTSSAIAQSSSHESDSDDDNGHDNAATTQARELADTEQDSDDAEEEGKGEGDGEGEDDNGDKYRSASDIPAWEAYSADQAGEERTQLPEGSDQILSANDDDGADEHDEDNDDAEGCKSGEGRDFVLLRSKSLSRRRQAYRKPSEKERQRMSVFLPATHDMSQGRKNAIAELLATEEAYVKDLLQIRDGYLLALSEEVLPGIERQAIFENWEELASFHGAFFAALKATALEDPTLLGKCFLGVDFTSLYEPICVNHDRQIQVLSERQEADAALRAELAACQASLDHKLPLKDYLLKPVQRIMRYQLLLSEQVKQCKKAGDDTGMAWLVSAQSMLVSTARTLNEFRREAQLHDMLVGSIQLTRSRPLSQRMEGLSVDISTLGPLLAYFEDARLQVDAKSNKPRALFCFDQGIVSCKLRSNSDRLTVKAEYGLTTCQITIISEHRFSVQVSPAEWDTYTVTNVSCDAILTNIYQLSSSTDATADEVQQESEDAVNESNADKTSNLPSDSNRLPAIDEGGHGSGTDHASLSVPQRERHRERSSSLGNMLKKDKRAKKDLHSPSGHVSSKSRWGLSKQGRQARVFAWSKVKRSSNDGVAQPQSPHSNAPTGASQPQLRSSSSASTLIAVRAAALQSADGTPSSEAAESGSQQDAYTRLSVGSVGSVGSATDLTGDNLRTHAEGVGHVSSGKASPAVQRGPQNRLLIPHMDSSALSSPSLIKPTATMKTAGQESLPPVDELGEAASLDAMHAMFAEHVMKLENLIRDQRRDMEKLVHEAAAIKSKVSGEDIDACIALQTTVARQWRDLRDVQEEATESKQALAMRTTELAAVKREKEALKEEVETLRHRASELSAKCSDLQAKADAAEANLSAREQAFVAMETQHKRTIRDLSGKLSTLEADLQMANTRLSELLKEQEQQLSEKHAEVLEKLKSAHGKEVEKLQKEGGKAGASRESSLKAELAALQKSHETLQTKYDDDLAKGQRMVADLEQKILTQQENFKAELAEATSLLAKGTSPSPSTPSSPLPSSQQQTRRGGGITGGIRRFASRNGKSKRTRSSDDLMASPSSSIPATHLTDEQHPHHNHSESSTTISPPQSPEEDVSGCLLM